MDAFIFKCTCCDHKAVGTEEQTKIFDCRHCHHSEWEKVGLLIEFEQFYFIDEGKAIHISKLTREQRVNVGLPIEPTFG